MSQIDRAAIRKQFQRHERDTGSSEVQIAVLTKEIEMLTEHLKANKKDHSSRYGLIRKVNTRRSLLDYLKREDEAVYQKIIKELGPVAKLWHIGRVGVLRRAAAFLYACAGTFFTNTSSFSEHAVFPGA